MCIGLLDLRRGEAHGRESLDIEQNRALDEIVERRRADVDGSRIDREGRIAFRRAVEIDQQAAAIVRKVAMRGRKADGIDRKSDRCLRFVDAPALCRRVAACASTQHKKTDKQETPSRRATVLRSMIMP
jgi:hypothetical protein